MSWDTVKTQDGRVFLLPTEAEDARIVAAAKADPDARAYTDEEWAKTQPPRFSDLPNALQGKLHGRSERLATKEAVKIRLDADVLAALRASGGGWQTRINEALRASLALAGRLS